MFDISWGEIAVVTGVTLVMVGRKDLPVASRTIGNQVGRIVGLIQGARLRADRFTTDHQLKQLQNEFKSGLRELDAVKAELAGSMMSGNRANLMAGGGAVGAGGMSTLSGNNNLGALVSGVDRKKPALAAGIGESLPAAGFSSGGVGVLGSSHDHDDMPSTVPTSMAASTMGAEYLAAAQQAESASQGNAPPITSMDEQGMSSINLAPRTQSVAAVAEEEWVKRGIGFRSKAEGDDIIGGGNAPASANVGGAVILSNFLRQSLIYDQYERTVREQDEALKSRVDKVRSERLNEKIGDS